MWQRSNRRGKIEPDEKVIGFRMSQRKYRALRSLAKKRNIPIAQLINETLESKLKLEHVALRLEMKKEDKSK